MSYVKCTIPLTISIYPFIQGDWCPLVMYIMGAQDPVDPIHFDVYHRCPIMTGHVSSVTNVQSPCVYAPMVSSVPSMSLFGGVLLANGWEWSSRPGPWQEEMPQVDVDTKPCGHLTL